MNLGNFRLRPATLADEAAMYDVCLKTGNSGDDGTHLFEDPDVLGSIFVGPYLHQEPDLAFVLEDAQGVCGYLLGALDSRKFFAEYERSWLPPLKAKHPEPTGDPAQWTRTQKFYYEYYHPDFFTPEPYAQYPSHLHIDLLPRAQGQGHGRKMMDYLGDELRRKGSPGVHLGTGLKNERAIQFYRKLGYQELCRVEPHTIYFGKILSGTV